MDTHESNGCCRDEVTMVKMAVDQTKIPVTVFNLPTVEPIAITPSLFIASAFYNFNEQRHFHNHSPPLLSAKDTYLQINVFRI